MNTYVEDDLVVIELVLPGLAERIDEFRETFERYNSEGHHKFLLQVFDNARIKVTHARALGTGALLAVMIERRKAGDVVAVYTLEDRIRVASIFQGWCLAGRPPWICDDREEAIKYLDSTNPGQDLNG